LQSLGLPSAAPYDRLILRMRGPVDMPVYLSETMAAEEARGPQLAARRVLLEALARPNRYLPEITARLKALEEPKARESAALFEDLQARWGFVGPASRRRFSRRLARLRRRLTPQAGGMDAVAESVHEEFSRLFDAAPTRNSAPPAAPAQDVLGPLPGPTRLLDAAAARIQAKPELYRRLLFVGALKPEAGDSDAEESFAPDEVTVDAGGRVYAVDRPHKRVHVFDDRGGGRCSGSLHTTL